MNDNPSLLIIFRVSRFSSKIRGVRITAIGYHQPYPTKAQFFILSTYTDWELQYGRTGLLYIFTIHSHTISPHTKVTNTRSCVPICHPDSA